MILSFPFAAYYSDDCTAYVVSADADKIKEEASAIGETVTEVSNQIEAKRKFCTLKEF